MKKFLFLLLIFGAMIGSKQNGFCTVEEHKLEEHKDVREPELDSSRITENSRIFEHLPKGPTDSSELVAPPAGPGPAAPVTPFVHEPGEIYVSEGPGQTRKLSPKEKADYLKRTAEWAEAEAQKAEKAAQEAEEEAKKAEQEMQEAEAKHKEEEEDILSRVSRFLELGIGPRTRLLAHFESNWERAKAEYEQAKRRAQRLREEADQARERARKAKEESDRAQEEAGN